MTAQDTIHPYFASQRRFSAAERFADSGVHIVGITAAIVGSILLLATAARLRSSGEIAALAVYAACLLSMLGFSAAYNMTPPSRLKWVLRRFDHSAIFLLIAGTYTPLLVQLAGTSLAWGLGAVVWTGAAAGIALKLLLPGRFDTISIGIYLMLGWAGVFAIGSFMAVLPHSAMMLIFAGGLLYTAGVVFHLMSRLKFQNAIWHAFVVAAAACHFAAIWLIYV
ncbi:MAG: hemolysin III family protein [Rhizobiales bacterium]|nr:hemolysin III family protein [Hyphomicrobiales bacterium]